MGAEFTPYPPAPPASGDVVLRSHDHHWMHGCHYGIPFRLPPDFRSDLFQIAEVIRGPLIDMPAHWSQIMSAWIPGPGSLHSITYEQLGALLAREQACAWHCKVAVIRS